MYLHPPSKFKIYNMTFLRKSIKKISRIIHSRKPQKSKKLKLIILLLRLLISVQYHTYINFEITYFISNDRWFLWTGSPTATENQTCLRYSTSGNQIETSGSERPILRWRQWSFKVRMLSLTCTICVSDYHKNMDWILVITKIVFICC